MDVTQAYQTVEARVTEALGLTPSLTLTSQVSHEEERTATPSIVSSSPTPTRTTNGSGLSQNCDQAIAGSPIDVTIPDDTQLEAGQSFTKVWRLQNAGACSWTPNYAIAWFSGDLLSAPNIVPLNGDVASGQSVDVSVDMVAPDTAGTYQSNWKLINPDGELFGIGPNGGSPFWVRIVILVDAPATPTPTSTPTSTPEVQVSGSVTLEHGDLLDLDNLLVNSGGEDLAFQVGESEGLPPQLVPQGNVLLGLYGNTQPTLSECQEITLSGTMFTVTDADLNMYLCYHTDMGLTGWARLVNINPDDSSLGMEIFTWILP